MGLHDGDDGGDGGEVGVGGRGTTDGGVREGGWLVRKGRGEGGGTKLRLRVIRFVDGNKVGGDKVGVPRDEIAPLSFLFALAKLVMMRMPSDSKLKPVVWAICQNFEAPAKGISNDLGIHSANRWWLVTAGWHRKQKIVTIQRILQFILRLDDLIKRLGKN